MKIYEYIPTKNLSRLGGLITIALALAAAFFTTPLLAPTLPFQWIFQLLSVIFLVVALYLYTRYVAKSFIFSIIAHDDGSYDMTVCELSNGGKRRKTVCRIGLTSIYESYLLHPELPEENLREEELCARARAEHLSCYDYFHDIKPRPVLLLFVEECGEKILIKFSPDEELLKYLGVE